MNNNYKGEELLNKLYPDLALSKEVLHRNRNPKYKLKNLRNYLKRIEKAHFHALKSKNKHNLERLKELYYQKYIIKEENIPERYYRNIQNSSIKRGYGAIFLDDEDRHRLAQIIISDQKKSLDIWIDYLFSDEINYPLWAKYWAFHGMLSLGSYSKSKKGFTRRNKSTLKIFPVLDEDALYNSIKFMTEFLNEHKKYDDETLNHLLEGRSFSKIYEHFYNKNLELEKEKLNKLKGEWIAYRKSEEVDTLVKSLINKGTVWCIRGFSTAKGYLEKGNIYVYYTKDDESKLAIPRIAIRMKNDKICEIRGVFDDNQNIEIELIDILEEKLKDFPYQEEIIRKLNNLKTIRDLLNKKKYEIEFNKEDLEFLYNYNGEVDGFGYHLDPRVEYLKEGRNIRKDLAKVYNCKEEQIALSIEELRNKDINVYAGDLKLEKEKELIDIVIPKYVLGDLDLSLITSSNGLEKLSYVKGDLKLFSLENAESLKKLEQVDGSLYLSKLESSYGLSNLKSIARGAHFLKLKDASYLTKLNYIGEIANFMELEDSKGLEQLEEIGWNALFNKLKNASGLCNLKRIGWTATFLELEDTRGLQNLKVIIKDAIFPKVESENDINDFIKIGGKKNFKQKKLIKTFVQRTNV